MPSSRCRRRSRRLAARIRRACRFRNVVLNESALAEEEKTTVMHLPGNDSGQAALTPHSFGSWLTGAPVQTFSCHATTLDAYVESRRIESLSFVKCDVEGAELLVLRGAGETIRRFTPLLFLEVSRQWAADFSYAPVDVVRLLEAFGYSRFFLVTDRIVPLAEARRDLDEGHLPDSANLLCAHDGSHLQRLARLQPWLRKPR